MFAQLIKIQEEDFMNWYNKLNSLTGYTQNKHTLDILLKIMAFSMTIIPFEGFQKIIRLIGNKNKVHAKFSSPSLPV